MKFLIDAQLPRRLAVHLQSLGHDVVHTLDMPSGNRTTDTVLNRRSVIDQRILITKDADFVNSFLLLAQPFKLLLVATGNIDNNRLLSLLDQNLDALAREFSPSSFVELNDEGLVVHG